MYIPVVRHKAVAEVSKTGNLPLPIYLPMYLSIYLSVYLSFYLSI